MTALETLRQIALQLNTSATALSALGVALAAHGRNALVEPALRAHVRDVLDALGATEAVSGAVPGELAPLLAELRTLAFTNAQLLGGAIGPRGWSPLERPVLQAAGEATARFAHNLKAGVGHQLPELLARLEAPGARFLDVGAGVAALSIEMARVWTHLRVVGIEPYAPALQLARENVRVAGLEDRIELRELAGEALCDEQAFDLVWVPSLFIAEEHLPELLRRALRALRPGGWLLFVAMREDVEPLSAAVARLRSAAWGGSALSRGAAESLLAHAGFAELRALASGPASVTSLLAARRS